MATSSRCIVYEIVPKKPSPKNVVDEAPKSNARQKQKFDSVLNKNTTIHHGQSNICEADNEISTGMVRRYMPFNEVTAARWAMSSVITDYSLPQNVTDRRILDTHLMELSRKRQRTIQQFAYETKMFIHSLKYKSEPLKLLAEKLQQQQKQESTAVEFILLTTDQAPTNRPSGIDLHGRQMGTMNSEHRHGDNKQSHPNKTASNNTNNGPGKSVCQSNGLSCAASTSRTLRLYRVRKAKAKNFGNHPVQSQQKKVVGHKLTADELKQADWTFHPKINDNKKFERILRNRLNEISCDFASSATRSANIKLDGGWHQKEPEINRVARQRLQQLRLSQKPKTK